MLKSEILQFFSQRSDVKFNRKVFVFLVCLVISFFSWLQINLSKSQTDNIIVKVDFLHAPKSKFGKNIVSDSLILEVEANGYELLRYKTKEVEVEFNSLKRDRESGNYLFLPNNYIKTIGKQMGENYKILRSVSDTIFLIPKSK